MKQLNLAIRRAVRAPTDIVIHRLLYSHGLSRLPLCSMLVQSASVLLARAIFLNSNMVKWVFESSFRKSKIEGNAKSPLVKTHFGAQAKTDRADKRDKLLQIGEAASHLRYLELATVISQNGHLSSENA